MQSPVLVLTDKLTIQQVQYSVSKTSAFPSSFEGKVENQGKITQIKQASDDHYIHFAVKAGFVRATSERPSQVYVSLKRRGGEGSLAINGYGSLNRDSGLYEVTFNVNKDLGEVHLNGEYDITVYASDYRASATQEWILGSIRVWYKEGHEEGSNSGIRSEYQTLPAIDFVYPPEKPQMSLLVRLHLR